VALQLGQPAINLLPVRRVAGSWIAADGTPLMPAEPTGAAERLLGIRPEDISTFDPHSDPHSDLGSNGEAPAKVKVVEYIGPTTTLLCDWAGSRVHIVIPRRGTHRPGDRLSPRINAARAVLFDANPAASLAALPFKGGSA
jgi:multiple sugar transport system ATP-binding protein